MSVIRYPLYIGLTDANRLLPARVPKDCLLIVRHYHSQGRIEGLEHFAAPSLLSVAGDVRLAIKYQTKGLHLLEAQFKQRGTLNMRLLKKRFFITTSCHSAAACKQADHAAIHAILLSPVLPTQSHPQRQSLGWMRAHMMKKRGQTPVYALGGMQINSLKRAQKYGYHGIAGVGLVAELLHK